MVFAKSCLVTFMQCAFERTWPGTVKAALSISPLALESPTGLTSTPVLNSLEYMTAPFDALIGLSPSLFNLNFLMPSA